MIFCVQPTELETRGFWGKNGIAARDAPPRMLSRALLEKMLPDHKVLPLMWLYPNHLTISHAGTQAEKSVFIKNQVFFGFTFAKQSFYFHHAPRTLSKIMI